MKKITAKSIYSIFRFGILNTAILVIAACGAHSLSCVDTKLQADYEIAFDVVSQCEYLRVNFSEVQKRIVARQLYIQVKEASAELMPNKCALAVVGGSAIAVSDNQYGCPDLYVVLAHELLHIGGMSHKTEEQQIVFDTTLEMCQGEYIVRQIIQKGQENE